MGMVVISGIYLQTLQSLGVLGPMLGDQLQMNIGAAFAVHSILVGESCAILFAHLNEYGRNRHGYEVLPETPLPHDWIPRWVFAISAIGSLVANILSTVGAVQLIHREFDAALASNEAGWGLTGVGILGNWPDILSISIFLCKVAKEVYKKCGLACIWIGDILAKVGKMIERTAELWWRRVSELGRIIERTAELRWRRVSELVMEVGNVFSFRRSRSQGGTDDEIELGLM